LAQDGKFQVTTVDIQQTGGIPADIDMLVITTAWGGTSYAQADFCNTADWVRGGGRLFLLNDHLLSGGPGYKTEGFVSSLLGDCTNVPTSLGDGPKRWLDPPNQTTFEAGSHYESDQPSALFNGVASWGEYDGASRYVADQGAVVTTEPSPPNYPAMIAREFGEGCAVMVGDSDWIQGDSQGGFIHNSDNRALANNVFRYLEHCGPWDNPGRLVRGRGNIYSPSATAGAPPAGEASFVVVAKHSKDVFGGQVSLVTADWQFEDDGTPFTGWLTAGNEASFEGTGRFNDAGPSYPFKIWAGEDTAGGEDSFRIKIDAPAPYYYDNCPDCEDPYNVAISKGRIAIGGKE
jgi:hypothetical protein